MAECRLLFGVIARVSVAQIGDTKQLQLVVWMASQVSEKRGWRAFSGLKAFSGLTAFSGLKALREPQAEERLRQKDQGY